MLAPPVTLPLSLVDIDVHHVVERRKGVGVKVVEIAVGGVNIVVNRQHDDRRVIADEVFVRYTTNACAGLNHNRS